jgi:hypothetical protein
MDDLTKRPEINTTASGEVVLRAVLLVIAPLVRWLIRYGVTFPEFSSRLKRVFLAQARLELDSLAKAKDALAPLKKPTDSALSLMSGVHRRDIREFRLSDIAAGREPATAPPATVETYGVAAPVFARWLTDQRYLDADNVPKPLPRTGDLSFDNLVASISSDVRPRSVLDQLLRFDLVEFDGTLLRVKAKGFVPRDGLEPMAQSLAGNLQDHVAAAVGNIEHNSNMLEQAIFVDEIAAQSVHQLHVLAAQTWQSSHRQLMQLAQEKFDVDSPNPNAESRFRARVGVYFYSEEIPKEPS